MDDQFLVFACLVRGANGVRTARVASTDSHRAALRIAAHLGHAVRTLYRDMNPRRIAARKRLPVARVTLSVHEVEDGVSVVLRHGDRELELAVFDTDREAGVLCSALKRASGIYLNAGART